MKQVLIVDDHTMFRQAAIAILREHLEFDVITFDDADGAESALKKMATNNYAMVIMDITMPKTNGMELLTKLKAAYPAVPVLMLSMHPEEQFALQALRLGASGYITKQEAADELINAIKSILAGSIYLSRSFSTTIVEQLVHQGNIEEPQHMRLSRREQEIFKRAASGQRLKDIGVELGLSIKTVSTYKTRVCAKMGFRSNAEMINYALKYGLV